MPYDLSIIVPSFNKAVPLKRHLASLSIQTMPHGRFEVLVVDDGSQDETRSVVEAAQANYDYRLRYFYLDRPNYTNPALPWNYGIKRAVAPTIVFMGADIIAAKDALELLDYYILESDGDTFVFGRCYMVHSRLANALLDYIPWQQDIHALETIFISEYHHSPYWRVPMLGALPKVWIERIGGYDENYPGRYPEDADLWVRLEASGVSGLNAVDVWAAHQFHPTQDPVCGPTCDCPLVTKSKTWPGPSLKYNGSPEDLVRNPEGWGEYANAHEGQR